MKPFSRVTIGIPTRNRGSVLSRAIDSALIQGEDVEVLITDNASTDDTRAICEGYVARDSRVRYVRHGSDIGVRANFASALELARARYFMWLREDDWLGAGYVDACTSLLERSSEHSLVSGMARYFEPGASVPLREDRVMALEQADREERVLSYFALVRDNGVFYGVSRREELLRLGLGSEFGAEWMLVACFALLGKVRTLQNVYLNRSADGSSSIIAPSSAHGLKAYLARPQNQPLLLAWEMFVGIGRGAEPFKVLGPIDRQRLALAVVDTLLTAQYGTMRAAVTTRVRLRSRIRAFLA